MLTEKANAICLLEVLREYSDAEHILPMREIIAKMQSLYGIKIDRRTVYGAVALLIELGYDISIYEDNSIITTGNGVKDPALGKWRGRKDGRL